MIQLTETHFEYGGVSSRKYGLIFANIDTSRNINLAGNISSSVVFNKRSIRNYFIGDTYTESPFSIDVEIVMDKHGCIDQCAQREIEKWLFHKQGYQKLYFDHNDDFDGYTYEYINGERKRLYINCRFTNPTRIDGCGGVFGYKATLESDSPLAWQEPVDLSFSITGGSNSSNEIIDVDIDTDLNDFIYPRVTIQTGSSGGDIIISNNSDDDTRLTSFIGVTPNTQIIMDGNINYISGQNYMKFFKKNFIRLVDGKNKININGDITSITFVWQNRRWL